jgi:hypothetical protein
MNSEEKIYPNYDNGIPIVAAVIQITIDTDAARIPSDTSLDAAVLVLTRLSRIVTDIPIA